MSTDGESGRSGVLGWLLALALLGYAALVYYGFGPYPTESPVPWWQPRGFLTESILLAPFGEDPAPPIAAYFVPALLLAVGAFLTTRSAILRALAVSGALATGLFLFYGLRFPGPQIWNFFGWRASGVMISMAALLGAALTAPWLTAAWLRQGWPVRLLVYLPLAAIVVLTAVSSTGTNPALRFNLSPWPVVTVFGLDLLATIAAALLACIGLALAAWRVRGPIAVVGVLVAAAIPGAWVSLALPGGLWMLAAAIAIGIVALLVSTRSAGNLTMGARSLAGYAALGAILLALPIFAGRTWAGIDYRITRDDRAQEIIDALADYYDREGYYPEELDELVEADYLDTVPDPRIGVAPFHDEGFSYQNLGSDYLLEFAAPGWTQCHYSPPWEEDYDEEEEGYFEPVYDEPFEADPDAELGPAAAGLPAADEEFEVGGGLGPAAAGLPAADEETELGELGPAAAGLPEADEEIDVDSLGPAAAGLPEADEEEFLDGPLPGQWSCPAKPPELW